MRSVQRLAFRLMAMLVVVGGVIAGSAVTSQRAPAAAPARVLSGSEMAQTFGDGGQCGTVNFCKFKVNCDEGQFNDGGEFPKFAGCWMCDNSGTFLSCCNIGVATSECAWGAGVSKCGGSGSPVMFIGYDGENPLFDMIKPPVGQNWDCGLCVPKTGEKWVTAPEDEKCTTYKDAGCTACEDVKKPRPPSPPKRDPSPIRSPHPILNK